MQGEWVEYWRSADRPLEAMHAHFEEHVFRRHSHDAYSFGVTEAGAQEFTCRGATRRSVAGLVMAFNPDDPHDGHAGAELGFTYWIVHIGPELVADILADTADHPAGRPLFVEPVLYDPVLADALRRLYRAIARDSRLAQDEAMADAVRALVARGSVSAPWAHLVEAPPAGVKRARDLLHSAYTENISAARLAEVAGCSRFALHRAFVATYGVAPSDYQRQLRLRAARRLLADGRTPAQAAAETGFADQSHLTRWFHGSYGITPGRYRTAADPSALDARLGDPAHQIALQQHEHQQQRHDRHGTGEEQLVQGGML